MAKKKNNKSKMSFMKYLSIFLLIVSVLILVLVYFINVLPIDYFIVLVVLVLIIDLVVIKLLLGSGKIRNVIGVILSIILIIIMVFGITYELNTIDFLKQFGFNTYKEELYNVLVLDESEYEELNDLDNATIGHLDENVHEGLNSAIEKIDQQIDFESVVLDDINSLVDNLEIEEVDAIILEDAQITMLEEDNNGLMDNFRIIASFDIETEIEVVSKEVNVTEDSYNILITGIDSYGSITRVSRSDVNMIVSVNPKDKKILLTSIPRDYYVYLSDYGDYDKLTHTGIYGIDVTTKALEDLLDIDINYYVKVNFTTLVDIVDELGGITVNSNYDFTSIDGYHFSKGENNLNGKEALSFARERQAFSEGDRVRVENQQLVLTAIINKVLSAGIITNYNSLLNALSGEFLTNITNKEITDLIKWQIDGMYSWDIETISLDGSNAFDYTYSYKNQKLYVMMPYPESVNSAKEKINSVL
ncbi:MAG TPA: LCP family protein [Candidatus Onthocola stercorigallinarum]|nr:LCP family protein [Candidatus Onthocola stercorigallinarum]